MVNVLGTNKVNKPTPPWIMLLIHFYRAMTVVSIGNDSWLDRKPFATQYPHLYSHVTTDNISVAECKIDGGWQIRTRQLTSQGAERELQDLLQRLDQVNLSQAEDQRETRFGTTKQLIHSQAKPLHASFWRHNLSNSPAIWTSLAIFNRSAENQAGTNKAKHRHKLRLPIWL
jgi:hypothetical protein